MAESRKTFNFESIILEDKTLEEEGYRSDAWGPSSAKFVWATCRFCGEPSRIRKGFFNKAGSACHKACKLKEQGDFCPFKDKKNQKKAKETNLKRYGTEYASQNKDIANKISETKMTEESQEKSKNTNLERYGVENPFQSEVIKQKIKETNLKKYGFSSPMQNPDIYDKAATSLEIKYGSRNMMDVEAFKLNRNNSFSNHVSSNESGKYDVINFIRDEKFWELIEAGFSLRKIADSNSLKYQTLASVLSRDEFKDKFRSLYAYPKNQAQQEIQDSITSWGLTYEANNRHVIYPLELDIWIPELSLAIEFNGSYWHSEALLPPKEAQHKHSNKTKMCLSKGIDLIHVFEHLWINRKSQILNFIRSKCNANIHKIGARKCDIDFSPQPYFIEDNHILGYSGTTIKFFNLMYEGKVVASMTASKHHRQNVKGNPILLNRMCFADECNISGGASRLWKHFKQWAKEEGYDRVISFSDNSITSGGVYENLQFNLVKNYNPDYFYWDLPNKSYLSKQSQKKSNTGCPKEITEREWAVSNKIYRIWDCGKKLWEYPL